MSFHCFFWNYLFVSLRYNSKILALAVKNIEASFIFLARLFVSLI